LAANALAALKNAYCPYSGYKVGSAVLADDASIHRGCNVENASYGLTICAERVAVGVAVSKGKKKFKAVAVASERDEFIRPCGACRQYISEFGQDIDIVMVSANGRYIVEKLSSLLPKSFSLKPVNTAEKHSGKR